MDSVINSRQALRARIATQPLYVYRHVDIENLKSKATHGTRTLDLGGARLHDCFSAEHVHHAKQSRIAEQQFGGAL